MRIKLLEGVRMAGPEFNYGPGDEVDVDPVVGQGLVDRGLAEMIPVVDPVCAEEGETATRKPQRKRATSSKKSEA